MSTPSIRDEALEILNGKGAILDTAREVSRLMREAGIDAAIIGGVAVVLHGHVRTTVDVDLFVSGSTDAVGDVLKAGGFEFDPAKREFAKAGVPVHLVTIEQLKRPPSAFVEIEGIRTVDLASLIEMKLRSGTSDPLRAQDVADVIGLIRHHNLTATFARDIDKRLRPEFRKLVKAVHRG